MRSARDEGNIMASLREAASEITPYATCAKHGNAHPVTSWWGRP
jgi:hypothetical protein